MLRTRQKQNGDNWPAAKRLQINVGSSTLAQWYVGCKAPYSDILQRAIADRGILQSAILNPTTSSTFTDDNSLSSHLKQCEHLKSSVKMMPFYFTASTPTGSAWDLVGNVYVAPPLPQSLTLPSPDLDYALLRSEAMAELTPQFKAAFDGAQFLYELKDFKGIANLLSKAGDRISNIAEYASRWVKRAGHKDVVLAEGHLAIQMAIKPTVSDVCAIHKAITTAQKSLNAFNAQGRILSRHHFSKVVSSVTTVSSFTGGSYRYKTYSTTSVTYCAAASAKAHHNVSGALDLFLQRWGLQMSPSLIWNAIPFSFCVDYFLSVNKMMASLSRDAGTTFTVSDYQESVKIVSEKCTVLQSSPRTGYTTKYFLGGTYGDTGQSAILPDEYPVSLVTLSRYVRSPIMPPPFSLGGMVPPRFKWPTFLQAANVVALQRTTSKVRALPPMRFPRLKRTKRGLRVA